MTKQLKKLQMTFSHWRNHAMTARMTRFQAVRLAFVALLMTAVTVLPGHAADRGKLEREATAVMSKLYQKYPDAKKLEQKAHAILVFPEVYKAGLMIGGETGDGVMRVKGKTVAYYNTSGVSYGLQAGAQKYGYALFIMTPSALKSIESADGFEIGTGPSVVVMDDSMAKKTSTTTINKDIYAFIFNQKGLMAGLGIQGNKLTRIEK
jgi:lipid-binding SYLF domain-containing protein